MLEHYFVCHISDHNDQLGLAVDFDLMLLQNNGAILTVTLSLHLGRQLEIEHIRFKFKSQESLSQCQHALSQIYLLYRLATFCHLHLLYNLYYLCSLQFMQTAIVHELILTFLQQLFAVELGEAATKKVIRLLIEILKLVRLEHQNTIWQIPKYLVKRVPCLLCLRLHNEELREMIPHKIASSAHHHQPHQQNQCCYTRGRLTNTFKVSSVPEYLSGKENR